MRDEVVTLFRELADLSPAERRRYCDDHRVAPDILTEVESLLEHDSHAGLPLPAYVAREAHDVLEFCEGDRKGQRCGPYSLIRLLGRGGAGAVFLAERVDGQIQQRVAIKLLRYHSAQGTFHDRFLRERQILASLQHPGIARVLDAGQTGNGDPYLVMEYIDGTPIDVYARNLDLEAKLNLFLRVCDAVSYAHRQLVIHRYIKPSNILVDSSGEPKLLDFGIAKILDAATDQTRTQERLLTPDYASPEQLRGEARTTATDVYSLGAVLYELFTGQRVPAGSPSPTVHRDLDFILRKALREEPEERYPSVESMADDIRAFLEFRPVRARSGNRWYRTRKFLRRYRTVVAAAAFTIAGLSAGLYVANRQRLVAQERFQQLHMLSSKVFDLDRDIAALPGATQARRNLVTGSLEYLQRLGASAHGDLDLAQEIAVAYLRVARIQGVPTNLNLGEFARAEENLSKADRFLDPVLAARPRSAIALLISAGIAHDRMIVANSERRFPEGDAHAAKAVARLDAYFRAGGGTQAQQNEAARYCSNLGLYYMNTHHYDEAVRYARQSIKVGGDASLRASSLSLIGNSLRFQGRLDEALDALREALSIAEGPVYPNPTQRALNLYGILLREARTLGQDSAISLGRREEAISAYEKAVAITEEAASKDPHDQATRDRLATCSQELADLLKDKDPQRSLAIFDLAIGRLREVKNNLTTRRHEAKLEADSSYPLRNLGRSREAAQRIEDALGILRETHDYPAETLKAGSEVIVALQAQADHESAVGDPRRAVAMSERLSAAVMASKPDTLGDLAEATEVSNLYSSMARIYRHAGNPEKAAETDAHRLEIWRHWDEKLPGNAFVQRQRAQ